MAEGPSIACPACAGRLTSHVAGNLRVCICDACGSAWFGSGQLDALVKHGSAALDELMGMEPVGPHAQHAEGAAKCPLCNVQLQPTTYPASPPVHASACYQCGGILLDVDSIQALDAAAKQRSGASSFGHQGGFGTRPPMAMPQPAPPSMPLAQTPPGGVPSSPPQVSSITSSLTWNRTYMQPDMDMRATNTLVAVDIAADLLSMFF